MLQREFAISRFFPIHFTISWAKNIVRFTEDFAVWRLVIVIEVPLRINEITGPFQL